MSFHLTKESRAAGWTWLVANNQNAIGGSAQSWLRVYEGPMPSAATFASWGLANLPANPLVAFDITAKGAYSSTGIASINNIPNANAARSGTAAYFVAYAVNTNHIIMGDITNMDGTGAIRLNDLNIVAGQTYSMQNISITVPLNYEF